MRRLVLIGAVVVAAALATASAAGAAGWAIQPTPNPTVPQGTLSAVSCRSRLLCEAVGLGPNAFGTVVTLAERWDGRSWRVQPTPKPAGGTGVELEGVSCTSRTACMAVGRYIDSAGTTVTLSERWSGRVWKLQPTPNPADASDAELSAVSCSSATACTAVGFYTEDGSRLALAERWDGSTWAIQSTPPVPSSYTYFNSVSCSTDSACIAVGVGGSDSLAEAWDGTSWTIQSTANPETTNIFYSVSCTSPSACTGVGTSRTGLGAASTFAERWDGTSWTMQSVPNPVGAQDAGLAGVSCASSTACVAIGGYDSGGTSHQFAEGWDGTNWTIQPNSDSSDRDLFGSVSCTSPSACTAVGYSDTRSFGPVAFAERWHGTTWTGQRVPSPAGAPPNTQLEGVSCAAAWHCVGVGSSGSETLVERQAGARWTIERTPSLAHLRSDLGSVSCATPTACVAVGTYYVRNALVTHPLAEGGNGGKWSLQPVPVPAGAKTGSLYSVSCTSPTGCIAVGSYVNSAGTTVTLVESWDGTSWSLLPSPNPAGATDSELHGVSCWTTAACIAVGSYETSTASLPLVEVYNGTGWMIQPPQLPTGAISATFRSVSCSAATACTAIGTYVSSQSYSQALVDRWDGSQWTAQQTGSPLTGLNVLLFDISCASSTACVAVGYDATGNLSYTSTFAEAWDGTTWTVQPSLNPPGAVESALGGVSCPTARNCTAVGSTNSAVPYSGDAPIVSLAETYRAP